MKEKIFDRFLRYVKTDTQSNPDSTHFPGTDKQLQYSKMLVEDLKDAG